MVQGLKFLSKKGFHPQNKANKEKVWQREQEKKDETRKIREREEQLKRERDEEELNRARGFDPKVNFLYKPPPGLETSQSQQSQQLSIASAVRHPGDDDAAAAFRRMLAGGNDDDKEESQKDNEGTYTSTFTLQGADADYTDRPIGQGLSELEKQAGKKNAASFTTFEEQVKRFPALKNAPRAKGTASDTVVTFNPLGTRIRNVKCAACGIWGHGKGDRECKMTGWDPFSGTLPTAAASQSAAHKSSRDRDDDSSSDEGRKRKHKRKKTEKKHKKKKERKHDRYDSDDSDGRRSRKKEKRRKHFHSDDSRSR